MEPVCDPVEDKGFSLNYPQFSPTGATSISLPEPLISLPASTSDPNWKHTVQCGQPPTSTLQHSGLGGFPAQPTSHALCEPTSAPPAPTQISDVPPTTSPGMGTPKSVLNTTNTLNLRVQHLEALCRDLQKEKNVMEEQFGVQRKRFMDFMMQKDSELSVVKKSVEKFSSEALRLSQQLRLREEEVQEMLAATKVRESANREAFDADRIKYEEEIASLRRIIDEQCSEDLKGKVAWQKRDLLGSELAKERQRSQSPGDPTLDSEMAKAVQESRVLKAVVVPLEEEIDHLRLQLEEARERLQLAEQAQESLTPPLIDLDTPFPSDVLPLPSALSGGVSPTPSDGNKLQQQLELERSARHDLEMHTTALEHQKAVLHDEAIALKKNLEDVNGRLTAQQESYQQLEQTWKMANQHFIVAQDKLRQQMYFLQQKQSLLQPPQPLPQGSPHGLDVEAMVPLPLGAHTSSRRSYSLGELREREENNELQTLALENELKKVRKQLEQQSNTCGSYEAQLQRVQEQMLEELDEKDQELSRLREECSKARAGVMREREAKEELRHQMEDAREQFKAQVEHFQAGMQAQQARLKSLREQYTQSKHEAQRDLAKFSDERVTLYAHISSAQEEYDCLKVVQAEETQKYAQHISEEKQERKMIEATLADFQLRLSELEQEKQAVEESLGTELAQLKDQLLTEQTARQKQELSLNLQLEAARNQITALELVKTELGQEQQMKEEVMASRSALEEKSRQFIAEQHRKLEMEVAGRQAAEQQVRELQLQVASLRSQLNTSQENQKDFVELSQALQVKLAKIEEEQKSMTSSPSHPL